MSRLNQAGRTLALGLCLVALTGPRAARARTFQSFVVVESEEDLYNLLEEDIIDQDAFDVLSERLETGVDLSSASRDELYDLPNLTYETVDAILAYRKEAGNIDNPASLVAAGILSEKELLAIAPFLLVSEGQKTLYGTKAWVRYSTVAVLGEARVPGMAVQARVSSRGGIRAGVATVLTRNRLGKVSYDSARDALTAQSPVPRLQLAKAFVSFHHEATQVIVGTYKIGFGQRLTFDNTGTYAPNGIEKDDTLYRGQELTVACRESKGELAQAPCTGEKAGERVTPDYRWVPRLLGVAGGSTRIDLGVGHLQAFGFASYQRRSVYQYDVLDRRVCSVEDEANDACNLSEDFNVYVTQDDPSAPAPEFKYTTLTGLYDEIVAGGNVGYWFGERARLEVTGYGAGVHWRIPQMELDFRRAARWPAGGPFGAVGISGALGLAWWDLGMEVTRSFDALGENGRGLGGGLGAILRGTGSWKKRELELSLRYYGPEFQNPFARPISAADERDGLRARDETGARVRFAGEVLRDLELRASADLWAAPSTGVLDTEERLRLTYRLSDAFRLSAWGLYRDKDLSVGGRQQCYETFSGVLDASLRPDGSLSSGCAGMKLQATGQVRYEPFKEVALTLQGQQSWLDDSAYNDRFRLDRSLWAIALVRPIPELRLRLRVRYLLEDVSDLGRYESWVWSYLEATYAMPRRVKVRLRYDLVVWLDERSSTALRSPSPEHWFWLTVEAKF